MESKLFVVRTALYSLPPFCSCASSKALKVVDLKEILTQAQLAFPTNIKKSDLITKILDSPAALDIYSAKYLSGTTLPSKASLAPQDDLVRHTSFLYVPFADRVSACTPRSVRHVFCFLLSSPASDLCIRIDWNAEELSETTAPQGPDPITEPQTSLPSPPSPAKTSSTLTQDVHTSSTSNTVPASDNTGPDEELEKRRSRAARFGIPLVEAPASRTIPPVGKKVSTSTRQSRNGKPVKPTAPAPPQVYS